MAPLVRVEAFDHIVLRVIDPLASVAWWQDTLGVEALRVEEFKQGRAPFPSVRVSASTVIDFFPRDFGLPPSQQQAGAAATAGQAPQGEPGVAGPIPATAAAAAGAPRLDHVCLALGDGQDMGQLAQALQAAGVQLVPQGRQPAAGAGQAPTFTAGRWGARGMAKSVYLLSPDGITVELRSYPPPGAGA